MVPIEISSPTFLIDIDTQCRSILHRFDTMHDAADRQSDRNRRNVTMAFRLKRASGKTMILLSLNHGPENVSDFTNHVIGTSQSITDSQRPE